MELLQRLDTWAALITLAAVAWFLGVIPLCDYLGLDLGEALRSMLSRRRVKHFATEAPQPAPDYVAPRAPALRASRVSPVVTGAETETEDAAETYVPPPQAVETPYIRMTQQQLDQLKARAWLEGAGHAVGTLQGAGYLDVVISSERLTDAKRAVFGGSGRTLTVANKLIAQATTKVAPATEDARLVPVRDGQEGYIEV